MSAKALLSQYDDPRQYRSIQIIKGVRGKWFDPDGTFIREGLKDIPQGADVTITTLLVDGKATIYLLEVKDPIDGSTFRAEVDRITFYKEVQTHILTKFGR